MIETRYTIGGSKSLNCIAFSHLPRSHYAPSSAGTYRDAWRFVRLDFLQDDFVVKRYIPEVWTLGSGARVDLEATIMERLSSSPRILDIYGHCGSTVHLETMRSDLWDKIITGEGDRAGFVSQAELDKLDDVYPQNNLTISEKLQISLSMAESLADLHNFPGGVMYHADTHIEQWLIAPDGSIKLNDFNNAKIMKWNRQTNRYCPFNSAYGELYRSPEEYEYWDQDESVDTYAFGNNIYTMLTGLWPFYDQEYRNIRHSKVQTQLVKGLRPFVDQRYVIRSFIERNLIKLMRTCWAHNPKDRPSMSEVVSFLRKIKAIAKEKGELHPSNLIKID
jgi:serine/threonine protein kinase